MFKKISILMLVCISSTSVFIHANPYDFCETCCDRFWLDADYLYWKIKDSPEPVPLVVSGPVVNDGVPTLGQPGTEVVLGGKKINTDWRSGGRFALGYWFDDARCLGVEASYFFLPSGSKSSTVSNDGSLGLPQLTIPFFNVLTGSESSTGLAVPGQFSGLATLKLCNRMQGAELNMLTTISSDCSTSFGLLAGFRYWNFNENLRFFTDSPNIPPRRIDVFQTEDKFQAQNNFYGGQIGAAFDYSYCSFFLNVKGKVALGAMCQQGTINGSLLTDNFVLGTPVEYVGGYFALPTNIGRHKKTRFSVLPEVNVNIGYQITDCLRVQVGYTFLYVTNVLWAGKQIDRNINPTQSQAISNKGTAILVGEPSPKAKLGTEGLWAQGLNVGLGFKF